MKANRVTLIAGSGLVLAALLLVAALQRAGTAPVSKPVVHQATETAANLATSMESTLSQSPPPAADSQKSRRTAALPELRLQGTLATGDADTAVAMLADATGAALGNFRVGEAVPGGGILSSVESQSVSIDVEGRHFVLVIDTDSARGSEASAGTGRLNSRPIAAEAFGAWDGELGNPPVRPVAPGVEPRRRSRSGPLLSAEKRRVLQEAVLAN